MLEAGCKEHVGADHLRYQWVPGHASQRGKEHRFSVTSRLVVCLLPIIFVAPPVKLNSSEHYLRPP